MSHLHHSSSYRYHPLLLSASQRHSLQALSSPLASSLTSLSVGDFVHHVEDQLIRFYTLEQRQQWEHLSLAPLKEGQEGERERERESGSDEDLWLEQFKRYLKDLHFLPLLMEDTSTPFTPFTPSTRGPLLEWRSEECTNKTINFLLQKAVSLVYREKARKANECAQAFVDERQRKQRARERMKQHQQTRSLSESDSMFSQIDFSSLKFRQEVERMTQLMGFDQPEQNNERVKTEILLTAVVNRLRERVALLPSHTILTSTEQPRSSRLLQQQLEDRQNSIAKDMGIGDNMRTQPSIRMLSELDSLNLGFDTEDPAIRLRCRLARLISVQSLTRLQAAINEAIRLAQKEIMLTNSVKPARTKWSKDRQVSSHRQVKQTLDQLPVTSDKNATEVKSDSI